MHSTCTKVYHDFTISCCFFLNSITDVLCVCVSVCVCVCVCVSVCVFVCVSVGDFLQKLEKQGVVSGCTTELGHKSGVYLFTFC